MLILTAKQIQDWDAYTIRNKPISSVDLMETAATRCCLWLQQHALVQQPFQIFCGKGNNGGDGLAIARLLSVKGCKVTAYILEMGQHGTADFQTNLTRLHETDVAIHYIQSPTHFPQISPSHTVIDALFGTGLNRPLTQLAAQLVHHINSFEATMVSVDIPSGLLADDTSPGPEIIHADFTLSFQCLKLAFMMAENERYTGTIQVLDIGLLSNYVTEITYDAVLVEEEIIKAMYRPRDQFSHKGTFGHASIVAGSRGFMGAAVLSVQACLRGGVGKLTAQVPQCGYEIMQIAAPEAMAKTNGTEYLSGLTGMDAYDAVGIGPGLGVYDGHAQLLIDLFAQYMKPAVVDADALNVLAKHPELLAIVPQFSIFTPHPGEFDRLFGKTHNDFERTRLAQAKARELQLIIVLKGHRTLVAMPGGNSFFNSTGNPGMATGGSGDVLTGILTSLLAQGYPPEQAALLGVYLHGLAGDCAAKSLTEETMIASDIIIYLTSAFRQVRQ